MPTAKNTARVFMAVGCLVAILVQAGCHASMRPASLSDAGAARGRPPAAEAVVLARGATIHGANGMRFDAENRLHVASVLGNEIMVMDAETGDVTSTIGANMDVAGPDDIAFGPDGSLYWTSFSTGTVGRIAPDGTRSGQMIRPGVNGIAFSPEGRLFVSVVFMGDAVYEIDPGLVGPPRLAAEKLGFVNGIDWGPDGLLYGPVWSRGEIVRINVDTGEVTPVAAGFNVPSAVKFDAAGRLHVCEQATGWVYRVDVATGEKKPVAELVPGVDNLAFDSKDRLFASHGQDGRVFEVYPGGGARAVCPGGMIAPGGIAARAGRGDEGGGEVILVADFWTLRTFDCETGRQIECRRNCIGKRGGITSPFTVAIDGTNLILTSLVPRDVVQVFNPDSGIVVEEYGDFDEPFNAIRFQEDIVVAERGTSSVVRISGNEPHERTVIAAGLGVPVGLAARGGDLWVSDWATGMVLQLAADGKVLAQPVCVANGFDYPEGLAVDANGDLLVVEPENGRLRRIDVATREVTTVVEGLTPCLQGDHPTWVFNGVAVGPSGRIYLTNDATNTVCVVGSNR